MPAMIENARLFASSDLELDGRSRLQGAATDAGRDPDVAESIPAPAIAPGSVDPRSSNPPSQSIEIFTPSAVAAALQLTRSAGAGPTLKCGDIAPATAGSDRRRSGSAG